MDKTLVRLAVFRLGKHCGLVQRVGRGAGPVRGGFAPGVKLPQDQARVVSAVEGRDRESKSAPVHLCLGLGVCCTRPLLVVLAGCSDHALQGTTPNFFFGRGALMNSNRP
ncbi:hypothetical protein POKO110462_10275 [Pontibacter korlensis]